MQRPVVHLETDRFVLRELNTGDATPRYLSWLQNVDIQKWIQTAEGTTKLNDLKKYVEIRMFREEVLFLGIFEKRSLQHIGNIKYEPIDKQHGTAVMGVLIGDADYRGKKVFEEVFQVSTQWIKNHMNVNTIYLGVEEENHSAIRAYRHAGFSEVTICDKSDVKRNAPSVIRMVLYV